jgi:ubiquinone/menaquinone biosynthesis C-methylase UbiE
MEYNTQFKNRINGYMYASSKYENVLLNENITAVKILNPQNNEKILHIAAAGVNIKKYIPTDIEIELIEVDQNEEFAKIGNIDHINLTNMPYDDNTFDKVIVIANFHHMNNTERSIIYKEIHRVLKTSGTFIMADVMKNSQQDHFLNEFVNMYNMNGHNGLFFNWSDLELFQKSGFMTEIKTMKYTWDFNSIKELNDFCYNFFNLKKINKSDIYTEIQKYLTLNQQNNQTIRWNWQLLYFISTVPAIKSNI